MGIRWDGAQRGGGGDRNTNRQGDYTLGSARKKGLLERNLLQSQFCIDFIEFFRGRPRGGDNFTSLFQVLQTLYSKRQKHPFSL